VAVAVEEDTLTQVNQVVMVDQAVVQAVVLL
jgi:hypothetical protein